MKRRVRQRADVVAVLASGLLATGVVSVAVLEAVVAPRAWVGVHQDVTPALTAALPPLGGLALVASLVAAVLGRPRGLRLAAALFLLAGMVVTVAVHFPMNAEIAGWSAANPPPGWEEVRSRWQLAHGVRTVTTVLAFALLAVGRTAARRTPAESS